MSLNDNGTVKMPVMGGLQDKTIMSDNDIKIVELKVLMGEFIKSYVSGDSKNPVLQEVWRILNES